MERDSREALFLHGGPGLSSGIERLWFGHSLPIHWWDQPPASSSSSPFGVLAEAAAAKLKNVAREEPVHLIAHSFGGQIAHVLVQEFPRLIRRVTLLGCPIDPVSSIVRSYRRIAEVGGSRALADAIATVKADLNAESFRAMVTAAASDPAYIAVHFGPESAQVRDRFVALMRQINFLDMATFLDVMYEFFHRTPLAPLPGYTGEVDLLMGRHDPVLSLESDATAWSCIFPQVKLATLDAGHLIHLETPPDTWFS